MPTAATFRTRVSQIAAAAVRLGVNSKGAVVVDDNGDFAAAAGLGSAGDGYTSLIADGETQRAADDMSKMSGCALTIRGIWRLAGLQDSRLQAPYKVGSAPRTLLDVAEDADAYRSAGARLGSGEIPLEGDALYLKGPAGEHFATFVAQVPNEHGGMSWITVDGGERDAWHGETIALKTRRLYHDAGRGWILSGDGSEFLLVGIIDVDALADHFGHRVVFSEGGGTSAEPAQAIPSGDAPETPAS